MPSIEPGRMEIATFAFADVDRAPYNPRVALSPEMPEYQEIKASLDEHGLVLPLVLNFRPGVARPVVVSGHQRMTILEQEHGLVAADFRVMRGLDERAERRLNLALNKITGRWDDLATAAMLRDFDLGVDLLGTGFDREQAETLLRHADTAQSTAFLDDVLGAPPPSAPGAGAGNEPGAADQRGALVALSFPYAVADRDAVVAWLTRERDVRVLSSQGDALLALARDANALAASVAADRASDGSEPVPASSGRARRRAAAVSGEATDA